MKRPVRGLALWGLLLGLISSADVSSPALGAPAIPALPPGSTRPPSAAPLPELSPVAPTRPPAPAALPELAPVTAPITAPITVPPSSRPSSAPRPATPTTSPAWRTPLDPLYNRQWNLGVVQAEAAWAQLPATLAPVTVAVLDTGLVDTPELSGRVVNGYDFVSDPARAGDGTGRDADAHGVGPLAYHGETVANLIAAAHDGRGMAGLAPQARVVQVRVAGADGLVDPNDLADGLRWAAGLPVAGVPTNPHPARLLNLSLYADFLPMDRCDPQIQAAVDAVTARGTLVIAGAGNDNEDTEGYSPASCRGVLTVTSVTAQGKRPQYANWGPWVSLAAPGGEPGKNLLLSSVSGPGSIREANGTSFAAPQVTGVAALLLGVRPALTPSQLKNLLTRSATPFSGGRCDPDPDQTCGSGTLNAAAAVRAALASSVGLSTATPRPNTPQPSTPRPSVPASR